MFLFNKKAITISVVNNDTLFFIEPDPENQYKILHSIPLHQFINSKSDENIIPQSIRSRKNRLLIVPDYWLANIKYPFQNNKKSLIEAFIKRKLEIQHNDLPDVGNFFEYNLYKSLDGNQMIYINYYHEEDFFNLYNKLLSTNLTPDKISATVFLCKNEVRSKVLDFDTGANSIIHLSNSGCFLYFFSKGNFLFDRSIILPENKTDQKERLNTLLYEINQSLYLFSQKTKTPLQKFHVLSSTSENTKELSKLLDIEVNDLSELILDADHVNNNLVSLIGHVATFKNKDIHSSSLLADIPNRKKKKEQEWMPIQHTGIAVGIILFLLISLEGIYIQHQLSLIKNQTEKNILLNSSDMYEQLKEYNENLDIIIERAQKNPISHIIIGMINILPDNYRPNIIQIESGLNSSLNFSGFITVNKNFDFKTSLSKFIKNINNKLPVKKKVTIHDVNFNTGNKNSGKLSADYSFDLKVDLN